jgi:hypothetical protein
MQVVKIYQEVSSAVEDAIQKEEPQGRGPMNTGAS